jgi:hypothetical protein
MDVDFEVNQQRDRAKLNEMNLFNDFGSLDRLAELGEDIAKHHFGKGSKTRFEHEIELLGLEDALDNFLCRAVALETSEASETLEEARLQDRSYENLLEEQTDVLIRTLNTMSTLIRKGIETNRLSKDTNIARYVLDKMAKNIERPPAHGGKRF